MCRYAKKTRLKRKSWCLPPKDRGRGKWHSLLAGRNSHRVRADGGAMDFSVAVAMAVLLLSYSWANENDNLTCLVCCYRCLRRLVSLSLSVSFVSVSIHPPHPNVSRRRPFAHRQRRRPTRRQRGAEAVTQRDQTTSASLSRLEQTGKPTRYSLYDATPCDLHVIYQTKTNI